MHSFRIFWNYASLKRWKVGWLPSGFARLPGRGTLNWHLSTSKTAMYKFGDIRKILFTVDVPMSLALWSQRWHSGKLPTWKEEEKEGEILFSGMISTVLKTLEPRMPPALQNSHTLSYGTCASLCKERVDSYNSNPESKYFATQWITYSLESLKDRGI